MINQFIHSLVATPNCTSSYCTLLWIPNIICNVYNWPFFNIFILSSIFEVSTLDAYIFLFT